MLMSRILPASSPPIMSRTLPNVMFSSWVPCSALVDGVNMGSGSFCDSTRSSPRGIAQTEPVFLYSSPPRAAYVAPYDAFHGKRIGLFHEHGAAGERPCVVPEGLGEIPGSVEIMWLGMIRSVFLNQNSEMRFRHFALCGYPFGSYHVEGRDAVGGYHHDALAEVVDVPYLAPSGFSQPDEIRVEYGSANGSVT